MSPSRKLFLAAALLAVGYGVANLLGSPHAPYSPLGQANSTALPRMAPSRQAASNSQGNASLVGGARLLPAAKTDSSEPAKVTPVNPAAPIEQLRKDPDPPRLFAAAPDTTRIAAAVPPSYPGVVPQQTEARSEARVPAAPIAIQPPANMPVAAPSNAPEQPAAIAFATNEWRPAGTSQVTFNAPVIESPSEPSKVSPPPWPAESVTARTHIIVDGDSLTKLAGRYLNDPGRGQEIFALNRGVLTNPELLPIGAEIRIPARRGILVDDDAPTASALSSKSIATAGQHGMVPISPVPTVSADAPRARLLGPTPVESPRAANQSPGY